MSATRFGPYRLISELGSGAQATVHLAEVVEEREGLEPGDRVALKVLHEHLGEEGGAVERFDREIRLLKAVNHENVLRLLDAGVLANGKGPRHYLATELVEGITLRALLDEDGAQSEALCRYVGRSVAQGLSAIHAIEAVHRDLKPENVILTKDQRVKVMDLGVALLRDDLRVSKTGDFVGSILYAAPEQFVSHDRRLDGRADLYSLGLVLFEMLTGRHPFEGEGLAQIMAQHLKGEPPRPSRLAPSVSPFFETLLLGLLAKLPADRPSDAAVAAEALEAGEASTWWRGHEKLHLARARVFRPAAPREYALCGRAAEIGRLDELWQRAKTGQGQAVLLVGEAGIGKTRLFDEFAEGLHVAGDELNYLMGSSFAGGAATATGAFSSAYLDFFGTSELDASLAPLLPDSPALVAPFADFLRGVPPPAGQQPLSRDGLHTAFIRVAQALATRRPTLIVLDDLHYAPQEGHALFAAVAQAVAGHPILLVGLSRPDLSSAWRANLQRLPHVSVLELDRLDGGEVEELLEVALGATGTAQALGARVSDLTAGNPFFILETLRAQQESGALRQRDDGAWILQTRAEDLSAPAVVRDLIEARVADLDSHDRDLLDLAAVCGFRFDPAILAQVLESRRLQVLRDLSRLERTRHLVAADGHEYRFDHHLVQEMLYDLVPGLLRREYHAAVGGVLLTRIEEAGERPEADAWTEAACNHLLRGDRGGQALRVLDRAVAHLETRHMHEAAARLLGDVLRVPGLVEGRRRAELLLERIPHLVVVGRAEDMAGAVAEALEVSTEVGDRALISDAEAREAECFMTQGRHDEALAAALRACASAEASGDPRRLGNALNTCGSAYLNAGMLAEARACHERGFELAEQLDDATLEGQALCNVARPLSLLGETEAAYEAYRAALALFTEHGSKRAEAVAAGNFGTQLQSAGRYDEAEPLLVRCLELSREIGYRFGEANALGNLGVMHYSQGRLAEALAYLERSGTLLTELGQVAQSLYLRESLGLTHMRLGHLAEARDALTQVVEGWRELGVERATLVGICGLAQIRSDEGDHDGAERLLRGALDDPREPWDAEPRASLTNCLGFTLLRADKLEAAIACLESTLAGEGEGELDARACLASLGRLDAAAVEADVLAAGNEEECYALMTAHYWLGRATGKAEHHEQAHALLRSLADHAPEADREALCSRLPLYRDIEAAWRAANEAARRTDPEA